MVVHVDDVGVDAIGPFVVAEGIKYALPLEMLPWAEFASRMDLTGPVEFGFHQSKINEPLRGYYAEFLDNAQDYFGPTKANFDKLDRQN